MVASCRCGGFRKLRAYPLNCEHKAEHKQEVELVFKISNFMQQLHKAETRGLKLWSWALLLFPWGKRTGPEPNICGFLAIKPNRLGGGGGVSDQEQWSDGHSRSFGFYFCLNIFHGRVSQHTVLVSGIHSYCFMDLSILPE